MANIKIASYNCKHYNGLLKTEYISDVFKKCDFMLLQEHWLHDVNFDTAFSSLDNDNTVCIQGKSAMPSNVIRQGRPHGGCAILWKSTIKFNVTPIDTISVRLTCVKITIHDNYELLLFNVYMPCDDRSRYGNVLEFQDVLAEIVVIMHKYNIDHVIIGGDYNTSFDRQSPQSEELKTFCNNEELTPCCNLTCSKVNYTYECLHTGSRSKIDHVIVSNNLVDNVIDYLPMDDINNMSDHLVVMVELDIHCEYFSINNGNKKVKPNWYKATMYDINMYKKALHHELSKIVTLDEVISCRDFNCTCHFDEIERLHNDIITACLNASKMIPSSGADKTKKNVRPPIPGWNDHCAVKKETALMWHWKWKEAGSPRSGLLYDMRKRSRTQYHYAIRKCQEKSSALKCKKMAECMMNKDVKGYWNEVRQIKGNAKKVPGMVDNISGEKNIAELFANKFSKLYNVVGYDHDVMDVISEMINSNLKEDCINEGLFTKEQLSAAIKNITIGKADGNAGVYSDHIVHGEECLLPFLVKLFNCMIIHGYSPHQMNVGTMIPIPKGKRPNISLSENFRGICLQSMFCKLLDHLIFEKEKNALVTSDLQFGFKPKLSSSLATAVVTETIDYYLDRGGCVYALALDASKAFDRVEYVTLFKHLITRNVNPFYVRILLNMYIKQQIRVSFNNTESSYFCVTNGVKQGGVLSPTLYSVYIDDLLCKLEQSGYGCHVGDVYTGSVAYADDLILLSPTVYGLDQMINICESFAIEHKIIFNGKKSKFMRFSKNPSEDYADIFVNNQKVEKVQKMEYLGHIIYEDRSNSMIGEIVNEFNVKVNTLLGTFSNLTSSIKNDLLDKYCSSFYGSNLCALYDKDMKRLQISQRKAIRRVWYLPWRAHGNLLPHISGYLPVDVTLDKRFMNFYISGLNSKNSVLKFIFENVLYCYGRIGRNLKHVCNKYDIQMSSQYKVYQFNYAIVDKWKGNCLPENIRLGCQVKELLLMRDSIDPWLLERQECQSIIDYLTQL